ncbi:hypothetical protein, partial [Thiohalocapsa sp.]|uniref:hypothetical protein n=1 Tax=Thiohalocapsa sp. TaxID=2497641 RepID=UPI0025DABA04
MKPTILKNVFLCLLLVVGGLALTGCSTAGHDATGKDTRNNLLVGVQAQRKLPPRDVTPVQIHPVSNSKFGLGSQGARTHTH